LKLQPWHWLVLAVCAIVFVAVLYRGHQVTQGQEAFERLGCSTCHGAGGGPSLEHVARKYDRATLVDFVADPETIYARLGRKPLNPGYPPMPSPQASRRDVVAISYFLAAQR
jgi:mono/diheme cytochrome c family protein